MEINELAIFGLLIGRNLIAQKSRQKILLNTKMKMELSEEKNEALRYNLGNNKGVKSQH
jgi:hypothetical protein